MTKNCRRLGKYRDETRATPGRARGGRRNDGQERGKLTRNFPVSHEAATTSDPDTDP